MGFKYNPFLGNLDIVQGLSALDARYLNLDQTTPQTMTGLADGFLKLLAGVVITDPSTGFDEIDGGFCNSVYLLSQIVDGGGA